MAAPSLPHCPPSPHALVVPRCAFCSQPHVAGRAARCVDDRALPCRLVSVVLLPASTSQLPSDFSSCRRRAACVVPHCVACCHVQPARLLVISTSGGWCLVASVLLPPHCQLPTLARRVTVGQLHHDARNCAAGSPCCLARLLVISTSGGCMLFGGVLAGPPSAAQRTLLVHSPSGILPRHAAV